MAPLRTCLCTLLARACGVPSQHRNAYLHARRKRRGGRNTTQPTAKRYLNSGWQYEGDLGPFSGTPIAPQYYITAQHIGF